MKTKILIIGSGPAGYTAGIYSSRAGLSPLIVTGEQPGGQLTITNDVENYPGYPDGINGSQMMLDFEKQAKRFGTEVKMDFISQVDFSKRPFVATTQSGEDIISETIIIATGASAKWTGIKGEEEFNGKGVSACAVCDGFFFKGQDVAVVGGGDTAAEEAHYLSKLCKKVYMLVRRDEMRASKIMQKRVKSTENIEVVWNTSPIEVCGTSEVESVKTKNNVDGTQSSIKVSGVFMAIGHQPNTGIFKDFLDMDEHGYIKTKPDSTATDIPGVFVAGDAQDKVFRQAVTAAGTGCMAALEAERFLSSIE